MDKASKSAAEALRGNPYPGRGILVGASEDGRKAIYAYFIMGRSDNSRNRVFEMIGDTLYTRAYDESKVTDPSLILYPAVRWLGDRILVTNGDQTDTITDALKAGGDFFSAIETRTYEPDAPNYTPRISALLTCAHGDFDYAMSILRRREDGSCERARFRYKAQEGVGHLLHTYVTDGAPLPSFAGAPKTVRLTGELDDLTDALWDALDPNNRISLFVGAVDLATGETTRRIVNGRTKE